MKRYFYILLLTIAAVFPTKMSAQSESTRAEIKPLLKTEWGQQAPFYYKTPLINGEHAKTGCVATAMSQVIYFHKFPTQGKQDVFSFDNFSFNFADHTFDYSKMKEKYDKTDNASDPSVEEVATLMYACGVTANMDYGVESSAGNFSMIPGALNEWFLYPLDGMGMLLKDYFTLEEWEEIVYEELSEGRPVLYMGGNGESSHVFVCDGYKDGKFHMNLGWYGEKNDYLPLSNLLTERVGKPGLWSMNSSQRIIRGVRLADDKEPGPLATASSFSFDPATNTFSLDGLSCYVNNTHILPGISLVNEDNSKEYVVWSGEEAIINRSNSSIFYTVALSEIEDGNYTIRPVYKLTDDSSEQPMVYPVFCKIVNTRYYTADISSNTITNPKEGSDIVVNVSVSEYNPASSFIKGENYGYGFTLFAENNGNTTITRIGVKFCKPGTDEEERSTNYTVSLAPGECKTLSLGIPYTANPGEYDMYIFDNTTKQNFCDPIRVIYHSNAKITYVDNSKYRFMPLSEDSDEAIILLPKTTTYTVDDEGDVEIESSVNLNGKEYRITELGPRLLYGREDITSLTIPSTVKKIDAGAFGNCANLSEITVNATTPPELHPSAFNTNTIETASLNVPEGSEDLYKDSPVWSEFNYSTEGEEDAPGSLYMPNFSIVPGTYFDATIKLDTENLYYGCQFSIKVPDGLTIASDGVSVADVLEGKNFTVQNGAITDDNSYTIVMFSSNNTPYPTGNNSIIDIRFLSDPYFKGGTISISDIMFSEEGDDNKFYDVEFDDITCSVTTDVETSVEGIISNNMLVDIYNVSGVQIFSNINPSEAMHLLAAGVYIVKSKGKSYKILKH